MPVHSGVRTDVFLFSSGTTSCTHPGILDVYFLESARAFFVVAALRPGITELINLQNISGYMSLQNPPGHLLFLEMLCY